MGRPTQGDGGQDLTCLGSIVSGWAILKMRTEEGNQVAGYRAIAAMTMCYKAPFDLDNLLPGQKQRLGLPLAVSQCRPATPNDILAEASVGQGGNDGSPTQKQPPTEECP
jgi:hypothetical protein